MREVHRDGGVRGSDGVLGGDAVEEPIDQRSKRGRLFEMGGVPSGADGGASSIGADHVDQPCSERGELGVSLAPCHQGGGGDKRASAG